MSRPRVVCIVGPTASGKTGLALALGAAIPLEVVSADSRQVYRGLDVGTAKPTPAERARVPHHGLDLVEPTETFDVARFRALADAAIADVVARGRAPVVAGGTGLWVRVVCRGLCPAPPRAPHVRAALRAIAARAGVPALHRMLAVVDPPLAARVHPHDPVRCERGLEVAFASGRRLSAWQDAHRFAEAPYDMLVLGLAVAPPVLAARVAARTQAMLATGFVEEVAALRARGVPDAAPAWNAVGYREVRAHVDGTLSRAEVAAAIVRATTRFARRQRTWFRAEPDVVWRDPDTQAAQLLDEAAAFLATGRRPRVANVQGPR
ncbi:MAG: tRNA (adenosine(37)-N6)-dimethylallyltransferase MiaA [bacterium]|nr:tRNA (adenosine(37)-N6)-dimethylallyltransferase MiaA [bacterium]